MKYSIQRVFRILKYTVIGILPKSDIEYRLRLTVRVKFTMTTNTSFKTISIKNTSVENGSYSVGNKPKPSYVLGNSTLLQHRFANKTCERQWQSLQNVKHGYRIIFHKAK